MITYEIERLQELRQRFDYRIIDKALQRALQVAATKTRTRISKEVRLVYNIKAGDIGRTVRLKRIPGGRLLVYIGKVVGLDHFGARGRNVKTARGKRRGVTVQVRKDRSRRLVAGGFVGGKGRVIFKREARSRLPIERLYGPSIPQMVSNGFVINNATLLTGEDAAVEFNRQLELLLGRPQ